MSDCVFCRIVAGLESNRILWWWPDTIVFEPLNPVTPGHVLVVPRTHVVDALDEPLITATVFARAAEWAGYLDPTPTRAVNLITSVGAAASQTIGHLHVHVVPRRDGDGLALPWSQPEPEERT